MASDAAETAVTGTTYRAKPSFRLSFWVLLLTGGWLVGALIKRTVQNPDATFSSYMIAACLALAVIGGLIGIVQNTRKARITYGDEAFAYTNAAGETVRYRYDQIADIQVNVVNRKQIFDRRSTYVYVSVRGGQQFTINGELLNTKPLLEHWAAAR